MATTSRAGKRQAIVDAAFRVFAEVGYAQACVQDIATEAGVAKPTIYNHLLDKQSLFREAVAAAFARTVADGLQALEQLRDPDQEARAMLEKAARGLLKLHCASDSWALHRLMGAEGKQFPDLLDLQHSARRRIQDALADRLARLVLAGRLRATDPDLAAEQLLALLLGPLELRSRSGTRKVPDTELRAVAAAAVDTFLRAYAAQPSDVR